MLTNSNSRHDTPDYLSGVSCRDVGDSIYMLRISKPTGRSSTMAYFYRQVRLNDRMHVDLGPYEAHIACLRIKTDVEFDRKKGVIKKA